MFAKLLVLFLIVLPWTSVDPACTKCLSTPGDLTDPNDPHLAGITWTWTPDPNNMRNGTCEYDTSEGCFCCAPVLGCKAYGTLVMHNGSTIPVTLFGTTIPVNGDSDEMNVTNGATGMFTCGTSIIMTVRNAAGAPVDGFRFSCFMCEMSS